MDLSNVDFSDAKLSRVTLKESKCLDAKFNGAELSYVSFEGCIMDRAQLQECKVYN